MIRIEPATDARLLAQMNEPLQRLHCELYPDEFAPFDVDAITAYFSDCLSKNNFYHFVAVMGETFAGFVQAEIIERGANAFKLPSRKIHVHQLIVLPEYRNAGVAKMLMRKVEEVASILGVAAIDLTVWEANKNAIFFYKSQGYLPDLIRLYKSKRAL